MMCVAPRVRPGAGRRSRVLAGRDHDQVVQDRDPGAEAGNADGASAAALSEGGLADAVVAIANEHEPCRSTGSCNGQDGPS